MSCEALLFIRAHSCVTLLSTFTMRTVQFKSMDQGIQVAASSQPSWVVHYFYLWWKQSWHL